MWPCLHGTIITIIGHPPKEKSPHKVKVTDNARAFFDTTCSFFICISLPLSSQGWTRNTLWAWSMYLVVVTLAAGPSVSATVTDIANSDSASLVDALEVRIVVRQLFRPRKALAEITVRGSVPIITKNKYRRKRPRCIRHFTPEIIHYIVDFV